MKKIQTLLILTPFIVLLTYPHSVKLLASSASLLEKSIEEKESLSSNTLEMPLISGMPDPLSAATGKIVVLTSLPSEMRFEGNIEYEKEGQDTLHLKLQSGKEEASVCWIFKNPLDLRNRWFRLRYTGNSAPQKATVEFDQTQTEKESSFPIYMNSTRTGDAVYFKVPDAPSLLDVNSLRIELHPEENKKTNLDFTILGIDLLPEKSDPLSPESSLFSIQK